MIFSEAKEMIQAASEDLVLFYPASGLAVEKEKSLVSEFYRVFVTMIST